MLEIFLVPKEIDKKIKEDNFNLENYILFDAERRWIHKTSNEFFNEKIKKIIYNTRKPVINEKYTSKILIERSKYFLVCPICRGKLIEKKERMVYFILAQITQDVNFPKVNFMMLDVQNVVKNYIF